MSSKKAASTISDTPALDSPLPATGAVDGPGAYNAHAKLQAGGATLALPLLEQAARNIRLETQDDPVVIAEYGSSQGKNSLAPMRVAVQALRTRLGPQAPPPRSVPRSGPQTVHHDRTARADRLSAEDTPRGPYARVPRC